MDVEGTANQMEGMEIGEEDEGQFEEGDFEGDEGFDEEDDSMMPVEDGAPPRTPKTPRKSMATRTPRPIPKSAFKSAKKDKKKKKKKPRKSQLDISALTDEQVALVALQSSQILHLKLRKRYYAESLNFMRQIEGAMEIIGQLLGSTNKPEVLESIEFFRVAHEYQFVGAEVSVSLS